MAEVANMGEVDEIHSNNEEAETLVNGDASNDVDMETPESPKSIKKVAAAESMEVDQQTNSENIENVTSTEDSNPASNGNHSEDHDEKSNSSNLGKNEDQDSNIDSAQNAEDKNSIEPSSPKNVEETSMETDQNNVGNEEDRSQSPDSTENSQNSPDSTDETSQDAHDTEESSQEATTEKADKNKAASETKDDENSNAPSENKDDDDNSNASSDGKSDNNSNAASEKIKENGDVEIHEIDDKDETVELHSSDEDEGDVMFVDSPKTNGNEIIEIGETPEKKIKEKDDELTPRRSARNVKKRSYIESDKESTPSPPPKVDTEEEESDIEEVMPQDPLAVNDQITVQRIPIKKPVVTPIIVKSTKSLVQMSSKTSTPVTTVAKKEPTLVIIDTNSILSGRGALPMNKTTVPQVTTTSSISVSALQGLYSNNMRAATITPIPVNTPSSVNIMKTPTITHTLSAPPAPPPPLLPTLTDDMFVVEAPSFIVPYVYEKPPVKLLKEFVEDIRKEILQRKKAKKEEKEKHKEDKDNDKENKDDAENKDDKEKEDKDKDKEDKDKEDKEKKDKSKEDEDLDSEEDEEKTKKVEKEKEKEKEKKKKKKNDDDDDDFEVSEDEKSSSAAESSSSSSEDEAEGAKKSKEDESKKPYNYFTSPLGTFFTDIGFNLVQEYVQTDLLKQQKRKREREKGSNPETNKMINSLLKNLENSRGINDPFKMKLKKCEFCNFKSESHLAMQYHLETPHMKNFIYKCNFCEYEVRSPHDILFHMEAEHCVRGHLERAPAFHQCPSCPFEDNQKGKLSRHLVVCARKFKPERNLEPPADWEPPAKIPRMPKLRQGLNATAAAYQAMNKVNQYQLLSKMQLQNANSALNRQRGRPTINQTNSNMKINPAFIRPQGVVFKQQPLAGGGQTLVPLNYQLSGNQVFQVVGGGQDMGGQRLAFVPSNMASSASANLVQNPVAAAAAKKSTGTAPSISITPLPRGTTATPAVTAKPGDTSSKGSFVICEICDGYIKDLEQLRNHMQWIHKIKIHPKMIHNRPPLNCQKCQFRFFTDQGLERHLLGSHGLVTSSMQDAANKSKDSGRCPVCGRVYQWKLLNHVARDHNMTLKPAHLSYKCTVCTATFGMYKQFENHVYSAHSVVAKRVMDKKTAAAAPSPAAAAATAAANKSSTPLKINDEITIIPQPAKANGKDAKAAGSSKNESETPPLSRSERLARRNASETE